MSRLGTAIAFIAFLLVPGLPAQARQACTFDAETKLDRALDNASDWNGLHTVFAAYAACDDGANAEGFSDKVVTLLADHWDQLPQLAVLAQAEPAFETFVLRHIDDLMSQDQEKAIRAHLAHACPQGSEAICTDVARRIDELDAQISQDPSSAG